MATPALPMTLKSKKLTVLPRGIPIKISTTYHDNTGRKFDSVNSITKARASRIDAIQIEGETTNHTYKMATLIEDRISIQIHEDTNSIISDYVIISVGEAIEPIVVIIQKYINS